MIVLVVLAEGNLPVDKLNCQHAVHAVIVLVVLAEGNLPIDKLNSEHAVHAVVVLGISRVNYFN